MRKEIGSNFDFNSVGAFARYLSLDLATLRIAGSDSVLLSTGRSAQKLVLDTFCARDPQIKRVALIPPYTCHTVIEPFLQSGFAVQAYSVDENLYVNPDQFRQDLIASGASVVLVHRYLGFDTLPGIADTVCEFRNRGVVFMEDRTQTLYSDLPDLDCDYIVGSLRKWAALPDGGYAVCRDGRLISKPSLHDSVLVERKLRAAQWKYAYLHEAKGEKQRFLEEFGAAEDILDAQPHIYRISPESEHMQATMDIESLKRKRRENYAFLFERLNALGFIRIVTPALRDGDVPLYMMLSVPDRRGLQAALREQAIYAPVIWPRADACPVVCQEAKELYDKALCLPIDQRYDLDDMGRMASCIEEFTNGIFKKA